MMCPKVREQELKYLSDRGVYAKDDEREAIVQYQVASVDTMSIDTHNVFEGSPCKSDHELLQEISTVKIDRICTHGWKR